MKLSAAAIVAGCGTTALALLPLAVPPYYTGLMIPFYGYAIALLGFNLLFGYTGLLSFGHAMFLGVGAYGAAILSGVLGVKSFELVLLTVRELSVGRVICVFGCGGDRDREKRPEMGRIASELADVVIVTNDNPRSEDPQAILDAIVAGAVGGVEVEPDRALAIAHAIELAHEGDVVLIAGKGAEQGQEFADRTVPFDDREAAREALRRLGAHT